MTDMYRLFLAVVFLGAAAPASMQHYRPFPDADWPQTVPARKLDTRELPDGSLAVTGGRREFRILPGDGPSEFRIAPVTAGQPAESLATGSGSLRLASVYEALLNGDRFPDYVFEIPCGGNGLNAFLSEVVFLFSQGPNFTAASTQTYGFDPRDLLLCGKVPVFLHTEGRMVENCIDAKPHFFWIYSLLRVGQSGLIRDNSLLPGFPKFIWYSFKPNSSETVLLTPAQKKQLSDSLMSQDGTPLYVPPEDIAYTNLLQPRDELVDRKSFGDYTVEVYGTEESRFRILKRGRVMYSADGIFFQVGTNPGERMGTDITGNGIPDLVVYEIFPKGHDVWLFEIGSEFRFVQHLRAAGAWAYFIDADSDGFLEYQFHEPHADFGTCMADIPMPRVLYKYRDGQYRPDVDLMRSPPPSEDELKKAAEKIKALPLWHEPECTYRDPAQARVPVEFWHEVLRLVYSGNRESALRLFDLAVPEDPGVYRPTVERLDQSLESSSYHRFLVELNGQ